MHEIGLGQLNLTPQQLDNLTPREFFYKAKGFYELQTNNQRLQYETARLTATLVLNSFTEKALKPTDLIYFPWEDKPPKPTINKDLFNRRVAQFTKKQ